MFHLCWKEKILKQSHENLISCISNIEQVAQRATITHLSPRSKRFRSKTTKKRWRHHFPHYKSMGDLCCHGNKSFDPICPQTLCSFSPTQLNIQFDQDWPIGFRAIQVLKCKIFVIQGHLTPKWVVWSDPKSNLSKLLCLSWLPATLIKGKISGPWNIGHWPTYILRGQS